MLKTSTLPVYRWLISSLLCFIGFLFIGCQFGKSYPTLKDHSWDDKTIFEEYFRWNDPTSYFYIPDEWKEVSTKSATTEPTTLGFIDDGWGMFEYALSQYPEASKDHQNFLFLLDRMNAPYANYTQQSRIDLLIEIGFRALLHSISPQYAIKDKGTVQRRTDKARPEIIHIVDENLSFFSKTVIKSWVQDHNLQQSVVFIHEAIALKIRQYLETTTKPGTYLFFTTGDESVSLFYQQVIDEILQQEIPPSERIAVVQPCPFMDAAIMNEVEAIDLQAKSHMPRMIYQGPSDLNERLPIIESLRSKYRFDESGNQLLFDAAGEDSKRFRIQLNSLGNYLNYYITHAQISAQSLIKPASSEAPITYVFMSPDFLAIKDIIQTRLKDSFVSFFYEAQPVQPDAYAATSPPPMTFFQTFPNPEEPTIQVEHGYRFLYEYKTERKHRWKNDDDLKSPKVYTILVPISGKVVSIEQQRLIKERFQKLINPLNQFNRTDMCAYLSQDERIH